MSIAIADLTSVSLIVETATEGKDMTLEEYQKTIVFPVGTGGPHPFFTGKVYLAQISTEQLTVANVTFEPGCRNNWHIHHATSGGGQMLICVEWGRDAVEMTPGTVIHVPANVKHWHGAAPDSWFSHLNIDVPGEDTSGEPLEHISDEDYLKAVQKQ